MAAPDLNMMTYRRVRPEESARLAELAERTFRDTFGADNTASDMDAYVAQNFTSEAQAGEIASHIVVVAEQGDEWFGYYVLVEAAAPVPLPEPVIELSRLYVVASMHGSRLGHYLMQHAMNTAREAGFKTIWLGVWEKNARAIAFYKKWIFREVGSKVFMLGQDAQRDLVFSHSL